jgi:hypothetical protein
MEGTPVVIIEGFTKETDIMGELVAMRYPTALFANLADHTYVECGTGGAAWSCWGGKTGGTELRRDAGSTQRADDIAGPDERGGITCYLINGVCHQAANRIVFPAALTVRGARGYEVSEALFGTYGRPGGTFGLCKAPFDQHTGTTGDLPACTLVASKLTGRQAAKRQRKGRPRGATPRERRYLQGVLAIYRKARAPFASARRARSFAARPDLEAFHLQLFMHQVDFKLGSDVDRTVDWRLRNIRRSTERSRQKIEEWLANRHMTAAEFVREFDAETTVFQHAVAGALKPAQYSRLFDLPPGTTVTLADPRIVKKAFKR